MGDRQWVEVLKKYYAVIRTELAIFRGREIDTAGDGFLATFEIPAQAVRCASAIRDGMGSWDSRSRPGRTRRRMRIVGSLDRWNRSTYRCSRGRHRWSR